MYLEAVVDRQPLPLVRPMAGQIASAAAVTAAVGAVACGVCCVLPFALPAVLLASTGGVLAVFASSFWWTLYVATALVAFAGGWVVLDARTTHRRTSPRTLAWLFLASAAVGVAAAWPRFEPRVIAWLQETFR